MLRYSVSDVRTQHTSVGFLNIIIFVSPCLQTSVPIRGNSDWAPPRRQVFHNVFLPPKYFFVFDTRKSYVYYIQYSNFSDIRGALVAQGCKCAGCSMTLDLSEFHITACALHVMNIICLFLFSSTKEHQVL